MSTYKVYDIRGGLLAPDEKIEACSPAEAVKLAGYENVKRDYSGRGGEIVVYGPRGSYVYFGRKKP